MPDYRSKTSTHGRNMAGARALWRATGMKDEDFKKPIIANRSINLLVSDEELAVQRIEQDRKGWKPAQPRARRVNTALKAYALLATSADKGAVRNKALLED